MEVVSVARKMHEPLVRDFRSLGGNIALLGGTFDPVHRGHLAMGEAVLGKTGADAVVFIPARRNPLKDDAPLASDAQRIEMLRIALRSNEKLFVSSIETERDGASYTVDTLQSIRELTRPGAKLSFICGADQLEFFHKWKDLTGIFSVASFYVLGRDGVGPDDVERLASAVAPELREQLRGNFIPFALPAAAKDIRADLLHGSFSKAAELLTPEVLQYIRENSLYSGGRKN